MKPGENIYYWEPPPECCKGTVLLYPLQSPLIKYKSDRFPGWLCDWGGVTVGYIVTRFLVVYAEEGFPSWL